MVFSLLPADAKLSSACDGSLNVPADTYTALTPHLHAGERLIWLGRPKQGLLLRREDAWLIPFSLLWGFCMFPGD